MRYLTLLLGLAISSGCDDVAGTGADHSALASDEIVKVPAGPVLSESDERPLFDVIRRGEVVARSVQDAVLREQQLLVVDRDGVLWRRSEKSSRRLIDRVAGSPVVLPDGSIVVSRLGGEPGESDLWLLPRVGDPRVLAPAVGPDDMPVALEDGRVAFVSGRTSVASIWVLDVANGEPTQLTNRGLAAGKRMDGFVPTPAERMTVEGGKILYETSPGTWWAVDPSTGDAREVQR